MALQYIPSIKYDSTFTLAWVGTDYIHSANTFLELKMTEPISGVKSITSYSVDIEGETATSYAKISFSYSNYGTWSTYQSIENLTGITFNECELLNLIIRIYFVYDQTSINNVITISDFLIEGERDLTVYDEMVLISSEQTEAILEPKDIYKIFSLTGFEVSANGDVNNVDIKFRFTQDDGRHYTPWTPLTTENISTVTLNELRFAQVQYYLTYVGVLPVVIYDIMLLGDFQNVSANYLKTNRYGLKEDCITSYQNNNNTTTTTTGSYTENSVIDSLSCYDNELNNLSQTQDNSNLWKPYNNQIVNWANFLGNNLVNSLGWNVDYYLTDPDGNGIDQVLHEYALKNVVDLQKIKIAVPDNKFPNETILINQFNLDLFDTFEIHITKDIFKEAFGIQKRPSQDDIVYICEADALYYVKHAQAFRNVLNQATYYKVILEKYEHKDNIQFAHDVARQRIEELTKNTTMEEIFGNSEFSEQAKIANKNQTYPTSLDKLRLLINSGVTIVKTTETIKNFDIINNYYDFSKNQYEIAVEYADVDAILEKGQNRSFINWFNINNPYTANKSLRQNIFDGYYGPTGYCNLLTNYDDVNTLGYKYWYEDNKIIFKLNENYFVLNPTESIFTHIWYGLVINLDQRQEKLNMYLYRRPRVISITYFNKHTYEKVILNSLDTTGITHYTGLGYKPVDNTENTNDTLSTFKLVGSVEYNIVPTLFEHTETIKILGSDIKYSNLRIFNEVIPAANIQNTLKQNIISDSNYLIIGDNANKKLQSTIYWSKNWK